jgi:hypothetical protein
MSLCYINVYIMFHIRKCLSNDRHFFKDYGGNQNGGNCNYGKKQK